MTLSEPAENDQVSATSLATPAAGVRAIVRGAVRDFWRCLPDLFFFDLIFKAIALLLLGPPLAWLFQRFVDSSGAEAIGNFDIASFLLTPQGAIIFLLLLALALTVGLLELAGLVVIGCGALVNRRVTYLEALRRIAAKGPRLVVASLLLLVILALILLPFASVALLAATRLLGAHDINYYLTEQPPEFRRALTIAGVLVALAAVAIAFIGVRLAFVFPELLVGDCGIPAAFRRSWRLGRGQLRRVFAAVLSTYGLWVAASIVLAMLLHGSFLLVLWATSSSEYLLLPALGIAMVVGTVANALLYFAGATITCLVVCRIYQAAHAGTERPLQVFDTGYAPLPARPNWKISRKAPLVAAMAGIGLACFSVWVLLSSTQFEDYVEITAHRAGAFAAPENTLAAVDRALADGATYLEIDVQQTADGEIVVIHDADLMRLAGSPLVVANSTLAELSEIDIGSRFDVSFADQRIATLEEFVDAIEGRAVLIIELKCYNGQFEQLVEAVVETVQRRDLYEKSVVMSLHLREMQAVRQRDPKITIGFVVANSLGNLTRLDVDFLAVKTTLATHVLIGEAHAVDKEIYVWTVNDPAVMGQMIDRGVDNIITDDPAALVRVLEERESLSSTERLLLRFRSLYGSP